MNELGISPLRNADAEVLCRLLTQDPPSYNQFFIPFKTNVESIRHILDQVQRDQYWGIRVNTELAGFFMLRGFDAGYEVPSFGVYIAQNFSRNGLAKLALEYALIWCRLNHCKQIMLSVHPDNIFACRTYEKAGFKFTGQLSQHGHQIYKKSFYDAV